MTAQQPAALVVSIEATSPEGYPVHIAISGEGIYSRARQLLQQLAEDGFTPAGQAHRQPAIQDGPQVTCPLHGQPMSEHRRGQDTWYSHRTADGRWCRGE